MKNTKTRALLLLISLSGVFQQACAPLNLEDGTNPQVYSLNGVKLIAPEITQATDPSSFLQEQYTVHSTHHLLLRFEELTAKMDKISVRDGKKVELEIAVPDEREVDSAKADLELCPLVQDWMMRATWSKPHPYSQWNNPGGDFDHAGCIRAARVDRQSLYFDITTWFIDYPKGRGQNFGLLLKADSSHIVLGEKSGSLSPRIHWLQ